MSVGREAASLAAAVIALPFMCLGFMVGMAAIFCRAGAAYAGERFNAFQQWTEE